MINLDSYNNPMSEEEFILEDRVAKIRSILNRYGEENFYISYSGGMDSVVLSELTDLALPENSIPRVNIQTALEFNLMTKWVKEKAQEDERIRIVKPSVPVIPSLKRDGYPFKSKNHSKLVDRFQREGALPSVHSYLGDGTWGRKLQCPKMLKYQFTDEFTETLRVSDACCINMKERPLTEWARENNRRYAMTGVMRSEGGRRSNAKCLTFNKEGDLKMFQPLSVVDKNWEWWFLKTYDIKLCDLYYPPYNRPRTGCKGCVFSQTLQEELSMMERYFPTERKQCEIVFGPVYDEYRRIGYRLKDKGCAEEYSLCA